MVYDNLIKQYLNLNDEEKNALLVYKSKLGLLINDLDNDPDFKYYYNYLKEIFNNPLNIFMKLTVYNNINLDSIEEFKKSIINIKAILDNTINKLVLDEDEILYRAVSTNNDVNDISKSNIISTSLSFGESLNFTNSGEKIYLYEIKIKKGSHVCCVPYSIILNKRTNQLQLTTTKDQHEIILDKNLYDFEIENKIKTDKNINIIQVSAIEKKRKKVF